MGDEARTTQGRAAQEASGRAARGGGAGGWGQARLVGPTCRREGEREERRRALVGRWAGSGEAGGVWMGRRFGFVFFFFFFFFKSISNQFQTLFKFKSFTCFQIKILKQISPTILKAFHKLFLTTFQTYFKFKPLHKFSQLSFHNYF
jgi:hypothetical protein